MIVDSTRSIIMPSFILRCRNHSLLPVQAPSFEFRANKNSGFLRDDSTLQATLIILIVCTLMFLASDVNGLHHAAFMTKNGYINIHSNSLIITDLMPRQKSNQLLPLRMLSTRTLYGRCNTLQQRSPTNNINSIFGLVPQQINKIVYMSQSSSDTELQKIHDNEILSSSTNEDEGDWRTMISAFQMYKAAYGDLKVPARFVVPSMDPWPRSAWKMKLGQRVAAIRSTGKYVQNNVFRRKMLDEMGFLWRLRITSPGKKLDGISFEQVYEAVKTYREQVQPLGALDIPPNYVVPDCEPWPELTRGLPLGKILPTLRSKAYFKNYPDAEAKLSSLGFRSDMKSLANDVRYQAVYDALVRYKELYGDLLVPQPFTVPENSSDWPKELWGLRLGVRVNAIRSQGTFVKAYPSRKDELNSLGFIWEPPINSDGKRRGRKRKKETEDEPFEDDEDNESTSDEEDGNEFYSPFALSEQESNSVSDLNTRDTFFIKEQSSMPKWDSNINEEDDEYLSNQKKDVTVRNVDKSFNETLEEMAELAMSVGIMERWTPTKRVVKGKINKFIPWRNDDFGDDFVFEDVVEALTLYKQIFKSFDGIEEEEFLIPEPVEESLLLSPFELAAMNNGFDNLDDLDGPWDDSQSEISQEGKFSVVSSSDWPEHLAGMKLGQIVSRIRDGDLEVKHIPERKAKLDEIEFDWGDPKRFIDVPFDKVMCALYSYFMIRGDTCVKKDFVMPDEEPWPTTLAGYELGLAVYRLRELQNFLEAYHPVKMTLLRMFDFMFFPELALPLDPDSDVMNMEHLYVETFGHPLYHISTVPLGLPEKMIADGPNGPPEKLSSWYNYEYVREYHERPGALTDVADWMRDIGFHQLAEEHEEKYGQSYYRQLFLLKEKLDNEEITKEIWDQEIVRIQQEVMSEFENWREGYKGEQMVDDGEYDYNIDEDSYYYSTLDLAIGSKSQDAVVYERPVIPSSSKDILEDEIAQFSLRGGDPDSPLS